MRMPHPLPTEITNETGCPGLQARVHCQEILVHVVRARLFGNCAFRVIDEHVPFHRRIKQQLADRQAPQVEGSISQLPDG